MNKSIINPRNELQGEALLNFIKHIIDQRICDNQVVTNFIMSGIYLHAKNMASKPAHTITGLNGVNPQVYIHLAKTLAAMIEQHIMKEQPKPEKEIIL